MPQLVPFYFINEVFFTFVIISTLIFLLSKYILPNKIRLFISRIYIKII
jgi:F-type H+-transporting ATPase subunit 8